MARAIGKDPRVFVNFEAFYDSLYHYKNNLSNIQSRKFCVEAIVGDLDMIRFVPCDLRDHRLLLEICDRNGLILEHIRTQSKAMVMKATAQNPQARKFVAEYLYETPPEMIGLARQEK